MLKYFPHYIYHFIPSNSSHIYINLGLCNSGNYQRDLCQNPGTPWESSQQRPLQAVNIPIQNSNQKPGTLLECNVFSVFALIISGSRYAISHKKKMSIAHQWLCQARVCVAWMAAFLEDLCRDLQYQSLSVMRDCLCLGLQVWAGTGGYHILVLLLSIFISSQWGSTVRKMGKIPKSKHTNS